MPVSKTHIDLVKLLINDIFKRKNFKKEFWFYHDNPEDIGHERPEKIGNSYPDILAESIFGDMLIIGEAKATEEDLTSDHAKEQIKDYFYCLTSYTYGEFLMSVPEKLKKKAEEIIIQNTKDINKKKIKIKIISK